MQMGIETPTMPISESREKKTNTVLNQLSKQFFEMVNRLWSSGRKQKYVEYDGYIFEDGPDQLYIPLDKDFSMCREYKGRFREEDSSFLCVLGKSKQNSEYMELKIYQKGLEWGLKDKNLVLSSSIVKDSESKENQFAIEISKDSMNIEDGFSILKNISNYLKSYFFEEEQLRKEKIREDEILHQIVEVEKEEDPDIILEKLWENWEL